MGDSQEEVELQSISKAQTDYSNFGVEKHKYSCCTTTIMDFL